MFTLVKEKTPALHKEIYSMANTYTNVFKKYCKENLYFLLECITIQSDNILFVSR
jgi:hypothetical protein